MTRIPSFENVLSEIHQGLGLERDSRKTKFIALGMELDNHIDYATKLIKDIFDVLGLDERAQADAFGNAMEFAGFHKAVELRTWTFNASQQEVLWHLLAYSYVPALARRLAFWAFDSVGSDVAAVDPETLRNRLWFMPVWNRSENRIELPLRRMIDQLLAKRGASVDLEEKDIEVRTLRYWRTGDHLPRADTITDSFPDDAGIRRQLHVARMVQDGYERLLEFLCPDIEAADCANPNRNKLIQVIHLFETVYSCTIESWRHGSTVADQDNWFETELKRLKLDDLLLSILPSLNAGPRHELLAECLTRIFMTLTPDSPLPDLVPLSEEGAGAIIQHRLRLIAQFSDEDARLERLAARVRAASPWRALQEETNYWVVMQFVQRSDLTPEIRDMALIRLRELADTDGQQVAVAMLETQFLLDAPEQEWPKDIQAKVQSLLDDVERSSAYEEWKAPLLRLRAKHRLFQNDFACAKADFDAALIACDERAFGSVRGEIARDAFAVTIGHAGLNPKNDKRYHRQMLAYSEFPDGAPTFEDTAAECEEFLWSGLYRPYPGVEQMEGSAVVQYKTLFEETLRVVKQADWEGLRDWLKAHKKKFNKNLKDARRNSVLLAWMKMPPLLWAVVAADLHAAIGILLEAWPEQATIADFKGQTPLMLAADRGDAELVRLVAPLSDVDAQDALGRTALHAAAAGRSPECVKLVLEMQPHVADKVAAGEENTVLHTAVRFGVPESVHLIAEEFPSLMDQANAAGQTPLVMAREISKDHSEWTNYMKRNGRSTGTFDDFERIIELLD